MDVAEWVLTAIRHADSWPAELERLRAETAALPAGEDKLARTLDLAFATEHIDPDRSRALALYLAAWRGGDLGARSKLVELAHELRAYVTLAEIAAADHEDTRDPETLIAAGRWFLDAGLPERAAEVFSRAREQHLSLEGAIGTSPRYADVRVAIAMAKMMRVDPEREIDACMARAKDAKDGAATYFLQAARIARLAKLDRRATLLGLAVRACPTDPELDRMFEDVLLDTKNADDFLAHHARRLEAAQGDAAWVECVRSAATELVLRNVHPGLGLRMMRTALERAFAAQLPGGMRRHLAAWELITGAAKESRSTIALAPLLAEALRVKLPAADALYIGRTGLTVAWRDAGDPLAAQPYVAALLDADPANPLAAAFLAEAFPDAPIALEDIPEDKEPVLPTITFKIPTITSAPPSAPLRDPAEPGLAITSAPPSAPLRDPAEPGLAIVSRAPSVELMRAASPIPVPPAPPPDAPPRSPRKVVPVDVQVELPNGSFFTAVLRDLSESGAFVNTKRSIDVGAVLSLEIRLPVAKGITERTFRIDARIARRTDVGYGLAFISPPPELVAGIAALLV